MATCGWNSNNVQGYIGSYHFEKEKTKLNQIDNEMDMSQDYESQTKKKHCYKVIACDPKDEMIEL